MIQPIKNIISQFKEWWSYDELDEIMRDMWDRTNQPKEKIVDFDPGILRQAEKFRQQKKPSCPGCDSNSSVVPILYGLMEDEAARQYVQLDACILGGCVVQEEKWHCKECEKSF